MTAAKNRLPQNTAVAVHKTAPFRVTYADTDQMGHVYYANYLRWFETGRVELLRSLGQSYKEWEKVENVYLPVKHCQVDYQRPAAFDDLLQIETSLVRLTRASANFSYRVLRQEEVLATGTTEHPFVNEEGRILRIADRLLPQFFSPKSPGETE